jgi:hypothetical protein
MPMVVIDFSASSIHFSYSANHSGVMSPKLSFLRFLVLRLNGHLLGWKPCKLLNAIALGQIKAMNKKTAFTAGLK